MDFKLTIFSDYMCPWCYVGQGVVERLKTEYPVEVDWQPFYLRPDTPPEGMDLPAYILEKVATTTNRLRNTANSYGMNFVHMPELKWEYGYPMAIGMMVLSAILPFLYFKQKGWL